MSTLADQLKALGLQSTEQPAPVVERKSESRAGQPPPSAQQLVLLRLARFGRVTSVQEERGFGFISADGNEDVFFHVRGYPGRLPGGKKLPFVGAPVLFITGSDPGRPGNSRKGAVLWSPTQAIQALLDEPLVDQASLDAIRRKLLEVQPRDALWDLLEAPWYSKSWDKGAPMLADLEDAVLEQVVKERLSEMSPGDLQAHRVSRRLANSRYRVAARLSPDNQACSFNRLLELLNPPQLAALGAPDVSWMQQGTLTQLSRVRLLEWHLLSRALSVPRGNWEPWFPGTEAHETELATRFLTYDIKRDDFTSSWLDRITRNSALSDAQIESWIERSPDLLLPLFAQLPAARQASLLATWRDDPAALDRELGQDHSRARPLLAACALTIDLESDGEHIWQIGSASYGKACLLFDQRGGTSFDEAVTELGKRIRTAPLLVGHNILAWDWPIASRHLPPTPSPLIWDTMLVQYLLEPQAPSHALGGRHRADQDAEATAQLFKAQLERLPAAVARGVLVGEFADSSKLLDALIEAVQGAASFAREAPEFLTAKAAPHTRLMVAPQSRLREVDWVPHVSVVSAGAEEGLASEWRQIDLAELQSAMPPGIEPSAAARILVAVAERAAAHGIALRLNMIPAWLLESDASLASAVNAACMVPKAGNGWNIAPLPARVEWWIGTERSSYSTEGLNHDVLVLDRQRVARGDFAAGDLPAAPLLRLREGGPALRWLLVDRAAQVLDPRGGFIAFTTLPIVAAPIVQAANAPLPACRPKIATRRRCVLHPRAEDQGSYWAEVLRSFHRMVAAEGGAVPILLISSSRSRELLELLASGLAELGHGEVRPAHRSQREHMLRAASRGLGLVDALYQWPVWQSRAQSAGVVLRPVVEALPIEEWHACAETRAAARAIGGPAGPLETEGGVAVVSGAALLEAVPVLVRARLHDWMADVGLSTSQEPPLLIDPRLGDIAKGLSDVADSFQLVEGALQAEQVKCLELVLSPFKLVREEAPVGLDAMERFLVKNWQPRSGDGGNRVTGFKPSQSVAMEAICERSANVLVSLPTGEGKSVLFQVPGLCRGLRNRRLTLVLSPLKALMRDQVERLREQGFSESADYLSSDRTPHEMAEVIQGVLDHRIVLLYIAPERIRSGDFLDVLYKRMRADDGLEHVVIDEAHCVNQWGYEFRPDYFHALELLLRMCREMDAAQPTPFLLLSATVTASDRSGLQAIMSGKSGGVGSPLPLLARPEAFTNPLRSHISIEPQRVRGMLNDRRNFDKAFAERLPYIEKALSAAQDNRASTGQRSALIVFVSSRNHAEVVAQRLARASSAQVDYYHAGLDAGSRDEVYSRFLDGDLDALVATKAFGMGMDIPDIHWVVHLSPPGYLEDYLQEVGRVGRGARERERAKLERLSATLLFSDLDFESIRTMRAGSALSLPIIKDLYEKVGERAYKVADQRLVMVPAEGYISPQNPVRHSPAARRAAATRVRMGLYWLERAGRVRLCGSVPDLMEVVLHPAQLERIALENGLAGEVAGLILEIEPGDGEPSGSSEGDDSASEAFRESEGGFIGGIVGVPGRLLRSLSENVGMRFSDPTGAPERPAPHSGSSAATPSSSDAPVATVAVLNLSQIKIHGRGIRSVGEVLAVLIDLERRGGLSLNREVDVVPRTLASEPHSKIEEQIQYVGGAVAELISRLAAERRIEFNPFEMVEDVEGPEVDAVKRRTYERSFINGFRNLARGCGIKLRQLVRDDEKVSWEAVLAKSLCSKAEASRERLLRGAQALFKAVENQRSILVSRIVDELRAVTRDGRFRESDFLKVAGLLSAMDLVSISRELIPLSHVVVVLDAEGRLEDQSEIWDELRQVNERAEARNLAMEVFANVNKEAEAAFIEGYFATAEGDTVKQFLDTQLGEIVADNAGGPSTILLEMQEKLRATKALEFFERFRRSEEPAQWQAAQAPFASHIMVNAGPGSGKTFVLVGRIVHLIREQSIHPSQIIVLAFNRAVVFEIRRRIRDLFKSLGYAAYAGRLRVSTFHSLAMRSLAREGIELTRSAMHTVLRDFASRMSEDPSFAQRVAGDARCLLVDEFQDATDDVYQIIRHIHAGSGSRAGVLVIGDDDQDILRWQRRNHGSVYQFSEKYFDCFARDFRGDGYQEFLLGVNFRSAPPIVERSQVMISGFFERTSSSRRLKSSRLRPCAGAPEGTCRAIEWRGQTWSGAVEEVAAILPELAGREGESTAVLCRSNAEVAEAHRLLSQTLPSLTVQGAANLRVAELRHVALWLDHLRDAADVSDDALSEDVRQRILARIAQEHSLPEASRPAASGVVLDHLWELCCRERSFAHLSSLIRFVEELRMDELLRLSGAVGGSSTAVVSTLHKVKGLEFDNVVILPSGIPFGVGERGGTGPDLKGDAAEEARLLYVGMTRAKKHLMYFRGDRERCWGRSGPEPYEGLRADGRVLVGAMEDVSLGWAMQEGDFNANPDACQQYIETEVAVGDPILLGGRGGGAYKSFMHRGSSGRSVQVGFLAKMHGAGGPSASLKVSAVVRFCPDLADERLADCVRQRGWGYAVLVTGRLR